MYVRYIMGYTTMYTFGLGARSWSWNLTLLGLRRLISRRTQPADCMVTACGIMQYVSIIQLRYIPVHTGTYQYTSWYILVCTPIYGHITKRCIVVKCRLHMTRRDWYRRPVSLGKLWFRSARATRSTSYWSSGAACDTTSSGTCSSISFRRAS